MKYNIDKEVLIIFHGTLDNLLWHSGWETLDKCTQTQTKFTNRKVYNSPVQFPNLQAQ